MASSLTRTQSNVKLPKTIIKPANLGVSNPFAIPAYGWSSNYSQFVIHPMNRNIDPANLALVTSQLIAFGGFDVNCSPVMVLLAGNGTFSVIDGQHRVMACQTLGFPIYYQVVPLGTTQLQFSKNGKQWTLLNIVTYWAAHPGKADYVSLFKSYNTAKAKLDMLTVACLLCDKPTKEVSQSIEDGTYVVNNIAIARTVWSIIQHARKDDRAMKNIRVIKALAEYCKDPMFDPNRMARRLKNQCLSLSGFPYMTESSLAIFRFYNRNLHASKRLTTVR